MTFVEGVVGRFECKFSVADDTFLIIRFPLGRLKIINIYKRPTGSPRTDSLFIITKERIVRLTCRIWVSETSV